MNRLSATDATRDRMSRQRSRNTNAEIWLRRELHKRGMRYRIHKKPISGLRREADVVFGPVRVAVFVDGCFWHGCPEHGTWPRNNQEFWRSKIELNRSRDADTDARLEAVGWLAVRVWEHEDPSEAAAMIAELVNDRRKSVMPHASGTG
ncbi:very short patch repair endonuclease [Nonomuraea sp. NPDC050663]|uniref:very short patch repair endonuclease n=1 Tax=Nonomuraea sp. NPDC050663 TaxID=3364370 RepID=UPI0037B7E995